MHTISVFRIFKQAFGLALVAALLLSATVFADDTPPEAPAAEEPAPEAAPVPETGSPSNQDNSAPEPAQPAPDAPAAEGGAPEAEAPALANAEFVNVVILDAQGEPMDMASLASADALTMADPYYTSGGILYSGFAQVQDAINDMIANSRLPDDGFIYVQNGVAYNGFTINGSTNLILQMLKGVKSENGSAHTTINSQINVTGTLAGFTLSGFTVTAAAGANGAVYFHENTGTLTLNDLVVRNTSGPGIYVDDHTGAVNLANVVSSQNFKDGAIISNATVSFPVTVINSEFDHNTDGGGGTAVNVGLWIYSKGPVTLNNVSASHNDGRGLYMDTDKTVTVKNSVFNYNYTNPVNPAYGYGMWIWTNYTTNHIVLDNVHADHNQASGFYLVTYGNLSAKNVSAEGNLGSGFFLSNQGTASITSGSFLENTNGHGLMIYSLKGITLNSITADHNGDYGVYLDNCQWDGIACAGSGAVLVAGTTPNQFIDNGSDGLRIYGGGSVTLTNIIASENTEYGVSVNNDYDGLSANVTINANYVPPFGVFTNMVADNGGYGISLQSKGAITIDKTVSMGNKDYGFLIVNQGAATAKTVLVKNSSASGTLNSGTGLQITSKGTITLTNVSASKNTYTGLHIDNTSGSGNVVVGASTFMDFSGNTQIPMEIDTNGTISINHVLATDSASGSDIRNSSSPTPKAVLITDSDFSGATADSGAWIVSNGPVTLRNVNANDCHHYGLDISNENLASPQNITMTAITANGNGYSGAQVFSLGNVTLSGVTAKDNGGDGVYVGNCYYDSGICVGKGSVILGGGWNSFNSNGDNGLDVYSGGLVNLSNFEINNNTYTGLTIDNRYSSASAGVTINASAGKYNSVRFNTGYGLSIYSKGTVAVSRMQANDNFGTGGYIHNHIADTAKNVTISDSNFDHNNYYGLDIYSKGSVILKGTSASGNERRSSEINNANTFRDALSPEHYEYAPGMYESWWWTSTGGALSLQLRSTDFTPMVYLYDANGELVAFDANAGDLDDAFISLGVVPAGDYRVEVASKGGGYGIYDIAVSNPIGSYSWWGMPYGVYIENQYGTGDVSILPLGSKGSTFNYNMASGAYVYSYGNITVTKAEAFSNYGYGYDLENGAASTAKNITLLNVTATANNSTGIYAYSKGSILFSGGKAEGNRNYGANLSNDAADTPKSVTISNVSFDGNYNATGLWVSSLGNITITNVGSSGNTGGSSYGLFLDNCRSYWNGSGWVCKGIGNISVTGTYNGNGANKNGLCGLYAESYGNISLKNYESVANADCGAALSNDYAGSTGTITISGTAALPTNFSDSVGSYGLRVYSLGSISLSYINAIGNHSSGIEANNVNATGAIPITLAHLYTEGNTGAGIAAASNGAITGSYLFAKDNNASGIYVDNSTSAGTPAISLSFTDSFENGNSGYELRSKGKVTLNRAVGDGNVGHGLYVYTDSDLALLSTLGANSFSRNLADGIHVDMAGTISLSKVSADYNGDSGMNIYAPAATLTINTGSFSRNGDYGIDATIGSNFTFSKLQVLNNGTISGDLDGFHLVTSGSAIGQILNSIVTGHLGNGIDISGASTLTLTGTFYYGNDTDFDEAGLDLNWH